MSTALTFNFPRKSLSPRERERILNFNLKTAEVREVESLLLLAAVAMLPSADGWIVYIDFVDFFSPPTSSVLK
jgi:hypothetical protein